MFYIKNSLPEAMSIYAARLRAPRRAILVFCPLCAPHRRSHLSHAHTLPRGPIDEHGMHTNGYEVTRTINLEI